MTFTYAGTLATDLDKIRFKIADRAANAGPLPGNGNFTDEEINGLLAVEGNVNRTIAALYEMLAAAWAKVGNSEIGPRKEEMKETSARYLKLAEKQRKDFGYSTSRLSTGFVTRVDGYSQDIAGDET